MKILIPEVAYYKDHTSLFRGAAEKFVKAANDSVEMQGYFFVALAGGNTPRDFYRLLAKPEWRERMPWEKTHIFFGDERCVPPDHSDSNYRMAREALLDDLALPDEQIHRMAGEQEPHAAAVAYEREIRRVCVEAGMKRVGLDLALLGLGTDGHTASLFPGTAALQEKIKLAAANYVEKFNSYRLTMTLPMLNRAFDVIFLVAGESKADVVYEIFKAHNRRFQYPAELVQPKSGNVYWLLDDATASKLQGRSM